MKRKKAKIKKVTTKNRKKQSSKQSDLEKKKLTEQEELEAYLTLLNNGYGKIAYGC